MVGILLKDLDELRDEILYSESQYVDMEVKVEKEGDLIITVKPKIDLPIYNLRPETFSTRVISFTNGMPEIDSTYLSNIVNDARKTAHRIGNAVRLLLANLNILTEIDLSEIVSKVKEQQDQ